METGIEIRCFNINFAGLLKAKMEYGQEPLRLLYNEACGSTFVKTDMYRFMLYIRLKDYKGRKIFEGDIVKRWHRANPEGKTILEVSSITDTGFLRHTDFEIEVIGNIYENPEILGKDHPINKKA